MIGESDFEIKHIKGKESRVAIILNKSMQVMHMVSIHTCEIDNKEILGEAPQSDEKLWHVS